jgi:hypothetical protein
MNLIIYTTGPSCGRCNALKAACQDAEVFFQEYSLDSRAISDCLCETGELVNSAPLVKVDNIWFFVDDLFDSKGNMLQDAIRILQDGGKTVRKEFTGGATMELKVQSSRRIWGQK